MALDDFANLKTQVGNWMARADVLGEAEDFITLAEARLNRELKPVTLSTTLTGSTGSRSLDISALSMQEPVSLFMAETGLDEVELTQKGDGSFPYIERFARPRYWTVRGNDILFESRLNGDYPFRFVFKQRYALSESAPTNWLLLNHPDVYLAACLVWGGLFIRDNPYAAQFQGVLNASIAEVRNAIAQSNRAILTVDPALQRIGRRLRGTYNGSAFEWA